MDSLLKIKLRKFSLLVCPRYPTKSLRLSNYKRLVFLCFLFLSNNFSVTMDPFYLPPKLFEAPAPPKEFQQIAGDALPLTCRYSLCWNKFGLHEVVLGTAGRKQGTSSKAACLPSTESLLCKRRLLQTFMSLEHPSIAKFKHVELSYREIKDAAQEYQHTLMHLREVPFFSCWRAKPAYLDSFAVSQ